MVREKKKPQDREILGLRLRPQRLLVGQEFAKPLPFRALVAGLGVAA